MSYLEYNVKSVPTGFRKLLFLNWPIILLLCAISSAGFIMLYSVAGGSINPWLEPQLKRFALGMAVMLGIAMIPIWFWRNVSAVGYIVSVLLLIAVELFGEVRMGAQRWINLGFMVLQPSELAKITVVMFLASYYDWLPLNRKSHPLWVFIPVMIIMVPTALVLKQPDLGTALLVMIGGGTIMFLAGVHWAYFAAVIASGVGVVWAVMVSKGQSWQLLKDYQYRRIETFLDPASDPLGAGYHITQAKIALGSGGWTGRGFMQGTQSRLNFLPEKHTDFIFTTLAEEFGFIGATTLLALYVALILICIFTALQNRDRFGSLLTLGITMTFFLYFAVNMSMVMGMAPVVGVPLPMVSYGGSAMLVLLVGFGLIQSAHVHRAR
ncbi:MULTISPECIES: rod shape-determining protein RodA [unclassified Marivivens]|jgi:rod shape determining protein RodA|uniref:rod shape-determining protein RodA n=1 Tax=unclassified Marivivens TaxID=2622455 RepID=UPI0007FD5B1D|nr:MULTISPECIES: rod shape-determining protein RodA [unclassified Marivivens]APO87520.1 rod shape-determining protein RodA [Marivivens sp. JLT3646]MCL7406761.1 rod shape-determining protein RodA [Marivivens geojensis]OBR36106.1 rod shape-determining protein RodA [Donghicola sp. JL3646]